MAYWNLKTKEFEEDEDKFRSAYDWSPNVYGVTSVFDKVNF